MANSLKKEIQELVQHIETNFQSGVDFEFVAPSLIERASGGQRLKIISPNLKKYCREYFFLPSNDNHFLDYEKGDQKGTDFYYRIDIDWDYLDWAEGKLYRFNNDKQKSKKCKSCGELVSYEKGQIVEWGREKIGNGPVPNVIAYYHPDCAKKYFADKERPNQNEISRLKEKLLRNLDKLSLDPIGYLANADSLKRNDIEELYQKGGDSNFKIIEEKAYKVEIEGEEIDLEKLEAKVKLAIRKAIIQEIKQNPSEWKIEECNIKALNNAKVLKHKSGRKHWNFGIIYFNESLEKGKQDWAEIETVINGKSSPVIPNEKPKKISTELTSTEKEIIRNYMEKRGIISLFLVGDQLIEEYKDKPSQKLAINNTELQNIKKCLAKTTDKSLNWEEVSNNPNSTNQPKSPNYTPLWIGLSAVGGIIIGMLGAYLVSKTRKREK